ncbi:hypothetical protein Q9L58_007563, partial [Maublancomyces gigas]
MIFNHTSRSPPVYKIKNAIPITAANKPDPANFTAPPVLLVAAGPVELGPESEEASVVVVEEESVSEEELSVVDVLVLVKLPVTVALMLTVVELPPTTAAAVVVELTNPLVWMVVDMCTTTLLLLIAVPVAVAGWVVETVPDPEGTVDVAEDTTQRFCASIW